MPHSNLFRAQPRIAREALQGGEQLALLTLGKSGPVQYAVFHQGHSAALAGNGIYRHPRRRQGVYIPVNGTYGYLKPLRQLRRRHPPPLEQQVDDLKQTA